MGKAIIIPSANFSANKLGVVTMSDFLPVEAIAIIGENYVLSTGSYRAKFFPTFTSQRGVSWSIASGGQYASVDSSGNVTALPGANMSVVTLQCTSTDNPEVFAQKNLVVTAGTITYPDYIQGDGGYVLIDGIESLWNEHVITAVGTVDTSNGYLFSIRYSSESTQARAAAYKSSAGKLSILMGKRGFSNSTVNPVANRKYKFILKASTSSSTNNATASAIDTTTDESVYSISGGNNDVMTFSGALALFAFGYGANSESFVLSDGTTSADKLYSFKLEDNLGQTVLELKPITIDGTPGFIDTVSGQIHYSATGSGLIAGND